MNKCVAHLTANLPMDNCVKGLLFDYGGTLDNNGDHWAVTIREAWQTLPGDNVDLDTFCKAYVYAERELARTRHILPRHNFADTMLVKARIELMHLRSLGYELTQAEIESRACAIAQYCDNRARACTAAAAKTLDVLAGRYPLALVSNFYGNVEAVLESYDLKRYFPHVIESAVVGIRKPDPAIFALGAQALALLPEQTAVIGDSLSKDIAPARSIGCDTVWIKGRPWFGDTIGTTDGKSIENISELETLY